MIILKKCIVFQLEGLIFKNVQYPFNSCLVIVCCLKAIYNIRKKSEFFTFD